MYNSLVLIDKKTLDIIQALFDGFSYSFEIFAYTLIFSLPLGIFIYFLSISKIKIISYITKIFVWVVRGVPLMLQIIAFYFLPPMLFKIRVQNKLLIVTIAFIINYACYFSEIYRSGFNGISLGQTEAGLVLGLKKKTIFSRIILLQVIKRVIPPIGNETTTLIKDTALAQVIALGELMFVAQSILVQQGLIWPFISSALFYFVFVGIVTVVFSFIEKKLNYLR